MRTVNVDPPAEIGEREGLAYALFLPEREPLGGVVILHGAGSRKESHFDYARRLRTHGLAAVAFDQRGHGDSPAPMDTRMAADVGVAADRFAVRQEARVREPFVLADLGWWVDVDGAHGVA